MAFNYKYSIADANSAVEKVRLYSLRWNVETFHKILKSGCAVESAQLSNKAKLVKYATMKSIIAWRIFWLSRNFRIDKKANCFEILTEKELNVLSKKFMNDSIKQNRSVTAEEVYIWIAKLGVSVTMKIL